MLMPSRDCGVSEVPETKGFSLCATSSCRSAGITEADSGFPKCACTCVGCSVQGRSGTAERRRRLALESLAVKRSWSSGLSLFKAPMLYRLARECWRSSSTLAASIGLRAPSEIEAPGMTCQPRPRQLRSGCGGFQAVRPMQVCHAMPECSSAGGGAFEPAEWSRMVRSAGRLEMCGEPCRR